MKSIDTINSKIVSWETLGSILEKKRSAGQKIIFTNGCFDILHRGHIEYLSSASDLGDIFVVGLNSDKSVRRLKGESRPAVDEESRALTMASFEIVDYVVLFDEDTPSDLIRVIRPDYWVKGGDYQHFEELPEYRALMESGGKVKLIPFLEGYSTTDIYKKIQGQVKK
ncbi:MAG: D-glycero-beta-D-manno-heptose 1-phosphate adenylyltransferase [Bacteroidales bacterium]|nr:D-glycero-beta-D-manno-heptose 1-phosphate adenylyltransferase [Bacteroidales bacterium]